MAETNSANEPNETKYTRGTNPRSLANLKAPWSAGTRPNPTGKRGPVITPVLQRMAVQPISELLTLAANPEHITAAEAIALMMILKASTNAKYGDKTREQVLERLDGINKLTFEVTIGNQVSLEWETLEKIANGDGN